MEHSRAAALRAAAANPLPLKDDWVELAEEHPEEVAKLAVEVLVSQLPLMHADKCAGTLEVLADLAREKDTRNIIGASSLIEFCVSILRMAAWDAGVPTKLQTLRVIGNLCFDNDQNRAIVIANNAVPVIMQTVNDFVATPNTPDNQRGRAVSAGVILNVANENEALQVSFIEAGAIEVLVQLIKSAPDPSSPFAVMAGNALHMLSDSKPALARMANAGLPGVLLDQLLQGPSREQAEHVITFVRELLQDDASTAAFATPENVDRLFHLSQTHNNSHVSNAAALFLSVVIYEPAAMAVLMDPAKADAFKALYTSWLHSDNDELRTAGAICVGNSARSEDSAVAVLASPEVYLGLVKMLESEDAKVLHAAYGALKNLSIAQGNKPKLASSGLLPRLIEGMQSPHQQIQYQCASIVRLITVGQAVNIVVDVANTPGLIARLVHLGGSEEMSVRMEATRALINTVRFGKNEAVTAQVVQRGAIPLIVSLLITEQQILINEALVALLFTASFGLDNIRAILAAHVIIPLTAILRAGHSQVEVTQNALSLAQALAVVHSAGDEWEALTAAVSGLAGNETAAVREMVKTFTELALHYPPKQ